MPMKCVHGDVGCIQPTHYVCAAAPKGPHRDNTTHHLAIAKESVMHCAYCGRSESDIRTGLITVVNTDARLGRSGSEQSEQRYLRASEPDPDPLDPYESLQ